jgi:hypothetical protein
MQWISLVQKLKRKAIVDPSTVSPIRSGPFSNFNSGTEVKKRHKYEILAYFSAQFPQIPWV